MRLVICNEKNKIMPMFRVQGHDTTAVAIAWCIYLIGLHPAVQRRVHEELDAIVGDEPEKNITLEDLKNLTYLDCVIKVGFLRKYFYLSKMTKKKVILQLVKCKPKSEYTLKTLETCSPLVFVDEE